MDSSFSYGLTLNKLNQNFQPTDGYSSSFYQTLPILSKDYSVENTYKYAKYHSLENEAILSFKFSLEPDDKSSKTVTAFPFLWASRTK